MIENIMWITAGLIVGAIYHAKLHAKHGVGIRRDNGG